MDAKQKEVTVYQDHKNWWRDNRYQFMSDFNRNNDIRSYGEARSGNKYYHLLQYDNTNSYNLLNEKSIADYVNNRFDDHKAGDKIRVFTNTVASQPCCFNLFAPLADENYLKLANQLFSYLLKKKVTISKIQIEFTPELEESIGDQSIYGGTDSDVAVFYKDEANISGVILIEFKYIENEFSVCSSYREKNGSTKDGVIKQNIRPLCAVNFYDNLIRTNIHSVLKPVNPDCGYLKYDNWQLTRNSSAFDNDKILKKDICPFRFSLNQIWRNMLLAEKVATTRGLDEFQFWVISPKENTFLWKNHGEEIVNELTDILSNKGLEVFRSVELDKEVISILEQLTSDDWSKEWLRKFRIKYLTKTGETDFIKVTKKGRL
jgi:hypothetical protein